MRISSSGPARCMRAATVAMDAGVEAMQQRHDLADRAFFQDARPDPGGRRPACVQRPRAMNSPNPCAGLSVRAGSPVKSTFQARRAVRWRCNIQVGIGQIEDGLGVAEFEIDAPRAHVHFRNGADHGPVQQGLEVPAARLGSVRQSWPR